MNRGSEQTSAQGDVLERATLVQLARSFALLGATGFGGPIALVGYMEREFVSRRRWISAQELRDGLSFAQLAPGPLAAQLAMYLGWLSAGVRGATVSAVAFIAPSFGMVIVLAALYVRFGGLPWLQGAFYGLGAAAIAVMARSAATLARRTLARDRMHWVLCGVSAIVTAVTQRELVWLIAACGLAAAAVRFPPAAGEAARTSRRLGLLVAQLPVAARGGAFALASLSTVPALFLFFATSGLVVFGSGLAIVPFLRGGVVEQHHWLTERQFLDAVAVALITPGPAVITAAFIGYLVAGMVGGCVAALGVFGPVFAITLSAAPHFDRLKANHRIGAFVGGVTAAATGALAGAVWVLARRTIVDPTTVAITGVALVLVVGRRRLPDPLVMLAAALVGIVLRG